MRKVSLINILKTKLTEEDMRIIYWFNKNQLFCKELVPVNAYIDLKKDDIVLHNGNYFGDRTSITINDLSRDIEGIIPLDKVN